MDSVVVTYNPLNIWGLCLTTWCAVMYLVAYLLLRSGAPPAFEPYDEVETSAIVFIIAPIAVPLLLLLVIVAAVVLCLITACTTVIKWLVGGRSNLNKIGRWVTE